MNKPRLEPITKDIQPLRPKLPVEVAIYAAACLVEDCEALKARAEQVLASLQTLRREMKGQKP